jgi:hypothetical protein
MPKQPSFKDLADITDREVQTLLREVDQKDLVVALKGADRKVTKKMLANMSERVRTFIQDEVACLGPLVLSEVEEVRSRILQQVRQLSEQGQITWPPGRLTKATAAEPKLSKKYLAMKSSVKKTLGQPPSQLELAEIDALFGNLAEIARRQGILAVDALNPSPKAQGAPAEESEFLTSALRLLADGTEPRLIREIMEHEMASLLHAHEVRYRKMVEGMVSLQQGDNPRIIEQKLAAIR